jgi:hypothetical protein
MTMKDSRMLRICPSMRPGKSWPAELMVRVPTENSRNRIRASGPSNTVK